MSQAPRPAGRLPQRILLALIAVAFLLWPARLKHSAACEVVPAGGRFSETRIRFRLGPEATRPSPGTVAEVRIDGEKPRQARILQAESDGGGWRCLAAWGPGAGSRPGARGSVEIREPRTRPAAVWLWRALF